MTEEKIPLSVAIITCNEEDRLPDCLASVAFADEVVVVDSGSSDTTCAIARRYGARVFVEPWRGFGPQKQFAIDQCRNQWVLVLDADERIPPETAEEISRALRTPSVYKGYSLPRKNFFCGRWLRHAGWWPDRVVRLFQRHSARMSDRLVHEALEVHGPVGELFNPILHYTNRDLRQTMEKINRYSSAGAQELAQKGEHPSLLKGVLRAVWAFLHNYIVRRGFLDGGEGFVQAVSDAVNIFFKYAKLWEMRKRPGRAGRR